MIVLVCGGREYNNRKKVYEILDNVLLDNINADLLLIHGACHKGGADILAEDWAKSRQVDYVGIPAKWKKYGKSAGYRRNESMLHRWKPSLIIAFPGGSGTKNMVEISRPLKEDGCLEIIEIK